jgi:multicomponent Na+:H+ antiporter subunit F
VILGVYSYDKNSAFFMDVALVLALISFVGTVTVAKYLDEGVVL